MEKYLSASETAIPLRINWKVRLVKGFVQFQPSAFHMFRECILLLLHIKFAALVWFSSVAQSKRDISLDFRQLFNIFRIVTNLLTYRPIHGPLSLALLLTSSHSFSFRSSSVWVHEKFSEGKIKMNFLQWRAVVQVVINFIQQ